MLQVPFGPMAFMPGKLIHTNEVMVLLGDNWFAEVSAKHSCEIISRRLASEFGRFSVIFAFLLLLSEGYMTVVVIRSVIAGNVRRRDGFIIQLLSVICYPDLGYI